MAKIKPLLRIVALAVISSIILSACSKKLPDETLPSTVATEATTIEETTEASQEITIEEQELLNIDEITKEFSDVSEKINELVEGKEPSELQDVIANEIKKTDDLIKNIEKDIEKKKQACKINIDAIPRITEYWNGVTESKYY